MRTFLMGSLPGLTAIAIVAATGYLAPAPAIAGGATFGG